MVIQGATPEVQLALLIIKNTKLLVLSPII